MARDNIHPNDRQLACARINSAEGQDYLVRCLQLLSKYAKLMTIPVQTSMACAANYAWVNRSSMTFLCRQARSHFLAHCTSKNNPAYLITFIVQAFAKMFSSTPDDLDMHVVYDVSHNIAKARLVLTICFRFPADNYFSTRMSG